MKIYEITGVTVYRLSKAPLKLSIHATGLAATSGWTNPSLDNSADPNPADAVLEFSFEATRPTGITMPALMHVSATCEIQPAPGADAVIVSARTNSITIHASEFYDVEAPVIPVIPIRPGPGRLTTDALGEEGHYPTTTAPAREEAKLFIGETQLPPRPRFPRPPGGDPPPPWVEEIEHGWGGYNNAFGRYY